MTLALQVLCETETSADDTLKWKSLAEQKKLTENLEEMTGLRDKILQQKNELQVSDKFCLKWRVNN